MMAGSEHFIIEVEVLKIAPRLKNKTLVSSLMHMYTKTI